MMYLKYLLVFALLAGCTGDEQRLTGRDVRIFRGTPVWDAAVAIRDNDTSELKMLLRDQPDSILEFKETHFGQSLLNWAVYRDNYSSAKILAELGADPNSKSNDSTSAVIHAANKSETSNYLELMIRYGGDVNTVANIDAPQHLRTPLIAASSKRLETMKLLVAEGANPDFVYRSKRGNIGGENIQSALISACRASRIDIVRYLLMEVGVDFQYVFNTTLEGKPLNILYYLRDMSFSLDSDEYKMKMEVVEFLKKEGLDYSKQPIPDRFYKNYSHDYLEKY